MYLDTKYLVTTGLGILLETEAEALSYPWFRVSDQGQASSDEIAAEYKRVKKLRSLAKQSGFAYRPSAKLRLPEASIDKALMITTDRFWGIFKGFNPAVDSWPADAQLAVMDMMWQNGPAYTKTWNDTRAAYQAQNWPAAADLVPGSGDRADFREKLFQNAARVVKLKLDKGVLWGTKTPTAPVVEQPTAPTEPVVPIELPPGPPKPERGDPKKRIYVTKWGEASFTKTPFLISERTRNMWLETVRLYYQSGGKTRPYITQGGYNAGGKVGASAGTHDGDAIDGMTKDMTRAERKLWELAAMQTGFAGWLRSKIPGLWPDHWHGIPKGGDIAAGAKTQVSQFGWSLTGLANRLRYARIARLGFETWTFEDYIASWGVSFAALESAFNTGKYHVDVKDLQWALSAHLGTDVVGDGLLGPQTKAALAKVGPLNVETLTKLGLNINP